MLLFFVCFPYFTARRVVWRVLAAAADLVPTLLDHDRTLLGRNHTVVCQWLEMSRSVCDRLCCGGEEVMMGEEHVELLRPPAKSERGDPYMTCS